MAYEEANECAWCSGNTVFMCYLISHKYSLKSRPQKVKLNKPVGSEAHVQNVAAVFYPTMKTV